MGDDKDVPPEIAKAEELISEANKRTKEIDDTIFLLSRPRGPRPELKPPGAPPSGPGNQQEQIQFYHRQKEQIRQDTLKGLQQIAQKSRLSVRNQVNQKTNEWAKAQGLQIEKDSDPLSKSQDQAQQKIAEAKKAAPEQPATEKMSMSQRFSMTLNYSNLPTEPGNGNSPQPGKDHSPEIDPGKD